MKLHSIEIWAIIAALLLSFGFVLYTYDKTLKAEKENEYLREQIAYNYILEYNDTGVVLRDWNRIVVERVSPDTRIFSGNWGVIPYIIK